ncbi:DUF3995 domain-containing protein [Noviherbaspirillum sp.]|uniref:DUF3995 domain-containing protein n=1 Tax=Noviherbaspirillum sp. TaxID=1926288 RepID=UPI0025FFE0F4|nr:DUF3995 domain-containing protein [Noviherbaspirillum sp.]
MHTALAVVVCVIFIGLALWHFRMAFAPTVAESGAVPTVEGKPLFVPSRRATITVGFALLLAAALVAITDGLVPVAVPKVVPASLSYALALGLLGRAVGEFKYLGFFKRVRGTRFAKLDTLVYSPLCLLLSAGVALVALHHGA